MEGKTRVLFMGTAEFGVPTLDFLFSSDRYDLVGVVTQPDKPQGRRGSLVLSPVKQFVINYNRDANINKIQLFQPESFNKRGKKILEDTRAEVVLVAAYGQIITEELLELPRYSTLNLHGSILPKWRGAVPVHMAILHGDDSTGVTLQKMVKELDAGPIISTVEHNLVGDEVLPQLMSLLAVKAKELIQDTLQEYIEGKIKLTPQEGDPTYCYQKDIAKSLAQISSNTNAMHAERMVRAFYGWPNAWFLHSYKGRDSRVKVFKAKYVDQVGKDFLYTKDNELYLSLNKGSLWLKEIQL